MKESERRIYPETEVTDAACGHALRLSRWTGKPVTVVRLADDSVLACDPDKPMPAFIELIAVVVAGSASPDRFRSESPLIAMGIQTQLYRDSLRAALQGGDREVIHAALERAVNACVSREVLHAVARQAGQGQLVEDLLTELSS